MEACTTGTTMADSNLHCFLCSGTAHTVEPGGLMCYRPTQFGAAFSLSFLLVAIYFAIQLSTESNADLKNTLQPASSNANSNAQGAFEVTLKAYGSPQGSASSHSLDNWCVPNFTVATSGFTGTTQTRTSAQ